MTREQFKTRTQAFALRAIKVAESLFRLELLTDTGKIKPASPTSLMNEGDEILSIVVASIKTARRGS